MNLETFEVTCIDNIVLKGQLLIPDNPKAVVQFNCGTGTNKELYKSFLTFLTNNGYICCLWDYRGGGDSATKGLANCNFTFSDYGIKDMTAIKNYLHNRFINLPFLMAAHSAGGQQIGFMEDLEGVKGVINFAVSSGYYRNMLFAYRMKAYFFFYFFSPISVLFSGFVKAKPFALMENLPKNVVYEWRDWLEKENYFFDEKYYGNTVPRGQFKNFKFPIHTYFSVDDPISNEANTKAFWKNIEGEKEITFTKLIPEKLGLKRIGHFGFFKRIMEDKLWNDVLKKMDEYLEMNAPDK
ncbi:MAG: alpha/beta hydrolase [Chitinophagaceae bacterium]|nr:alpha/beta hydrolase [Chitinophagaceae bacterium]